MDLHRERIPPYPVYLLGIKNLWQMTCCILSHHLFSCLPRCQTTLKQPGSHQCIILKLWLRYQLLGHMRKININLTHKFREKTLSTWHHTISWIYIRMRDYQITSGKAVIALNVRVMPALGYVADRTFTLMTLLGLWLVRSECSLFRSWQCMTNGIHIMETAHWSCFHLRFPQIHLIRTQEMMHSVNYKINKTLPKRIFKRNMIHINCTTICCNY